MKSKQASYPLSLLLALGIVLSLLTAGCSSSGNSSSDTPSGEQTSSNISGVISISGSSTVEPISTRVKETYNENVSNKVEITVNGPGTSAGFREFCPGNTDINDASRTIKPKELENLSLIHI